MNTFWKRLAPGGIQDDIGRDLHFLHTLIDHVPDMIYIKDLDSRFVLVNRATLNRFGFTSADQMIGRTDVDLFGEVGYEFMQREQQLMATGKPSLNDEWFSTDFQGNPFWVLINKIPLRDIDGQIIGLIGINRNITQRKLAEQSIRTEKDRFLAAAEGSLNAFYILESIRDDSGVIMDFRFTYVNSRGEDMIYMSRDQIIGQRLCELLPINRTGGFFEKYVKVVESREYLDEEFSIPSRDGGLSWRHHQVVPLGDGIAIVSQDITERKQTEDQVHYQASLIENISDAVISTRLDYTIVSWNAGAETMYGWKADEVLGKPLNVLVVSHQMAEGTLAEREQEFMAQGYWRGETIHQRRDGSLFPVMSAVSLVRDSTGQVVGAVAVNRDVTESKQAEAQRLELALERERVNTLRRFISDITHDLRNPLSTAKINLYLLEKTLDDPVKRDYQLEVLGSQIARLETMLEDLLTLSRLDQVAEEFHFKPGDINSLVHQIVMDQEVVAARRSQRCIFKPGADVPHVMADTGKLYRAVNNLVVNALKYTQDGGEVILSTEVVEQGVVIAVQDNGIGIDAEDLPFIFERYFQAGTIKASHSGAGLGLAIAKRIVDAHHGQLTVESTLGKGSIFRIWLPLYSPNPC